MEYILVFSSKDILGLRHMPEDDISMILDTAVAMKEIHTRTVKKVPALRGKVVVNAFFEPSTRTRISFELAAKRLSADVVSIASSTSSVTKGETLWDTVRTLRAMGADLFIIRQGSSGAPHIIADLVDVPVVNAGDGINEHPTQGLLDMFTLREVLGSLEGITVVYVGDILHSRVARSGIWGLTKMGAKVRIATPPTLVPRGIEKMGVEVFYDLKAALKGADAVNVLRIQKERMKGNFFPSLREYHRLFGVTKDVLKHASKDLVVMHPGPANRGVEIDGDVADADNAQIQNQVSNGIAVRMAIMYLLATGRAIKAGESVTED
jgi:aspartate carbamoyltransferase catalytic subunit